MNKPAIRKDEPAATPLSKSTASSPLDWPGPPAAAVIRPRPAVMQAQAQAQAHAQARQDELLRQLAERARSQRLRHQLERIHHGACGDAAAAGLGQSGTAAAGLGQSSTAGGADS
jgi:hypothetical protein